VTALAAFAAVVDVGHVAARPAAADPVLEEAPVRYGPYRQSLGHGASLEYAITYGEDARLGPDATGDGWHVLAPERPNTVDFHGIMPWGSQNWYVELYVVAGSGTPQPTDLRKAYTPWSCNCFAGANHDMNPNVTWSGLDGGSLWARATFTTSTWPYERDTGYVKLAAPGCACALPSVRTAAQVENEPPTSIVYAPADGSVVHRSTPEHLQELSALFGDREHHNISFRFRVTGPGTEPIQYDGEARAVPPAPRQARRYDQGAYPLPISTPPLRLPHVNGTYTVEVRAIDTSARPTAMGAWSRVTTFEYIWNLPPGVPAHEVPGPHRTFPADTPLVFVARAYDAENDNVTTKTVIDGRTYYSLPAASGGPAVTVIPDGVRAGEDRTAVVSAIDVNGEEGAPSTITFDAVGLPDAPTNRAPDAPALVTPLEAATFAAGAPQDFVLRAVDPDGDRWRGVVEITDAAGALAASFATDEASSGSTASARPLTPLAAGAYRWRARAFDAKGALGPASAWRSFSVASSAAAVVSDDCATGATVTQATAGGHYAHLQALGNDACWRVDGPAAGSGGKLTVTLPGATVPPLASVDGDTSACSTVLLAGTVGDPSDPATYVPYRVATALGTGEASLCVDLGDERRRLRQRFPGAVGTPTIGLAFDRPGRSAAPIDPTPGLPSTACSGRTGSTTHLAGAAGPVFAHVTSWQETATRRHVCVRQQWTSGAGGPTVGGRFTVDTTGTPGVVPTLATGTDLGPCTVGVASVTAPARAEVRRSSTTNPASVCVALAGVPLRVTLGASGSPTPPTVTWTPDPGTPGL
jgi:hypothetical protein